MPLVVKMSLACKSPGPLSLGLGVPASWPTSTHATRLCSLCFLRLARDLCMRTMKDSRICITHMGIVCKRGRDLVHVWWLFSVSLDIASSKIRSAALLMSETDQPPPHESKGEVVESTCLPISPSLHDGAQTFVAKGAAESMSEAVDAEAARRCNELFSGEMMP